MLNHNLLEYRVHYLQLKILMLQQVLEVRVAPVLLGHMVPTAVLEVLAEQVVQQQVRRLMEEVWLVTTLPPENQ